MGLLTENSKIISLDNYLLSTNSVAPNGNLLLRLTKSNISYDEQMSLRQWNYKNKSFRKNTTDFEGAGIGDISYRNGGSIPNSITNTFMRHEDISDDFYLTGNHCISIDIAPNVDYSLMSTTFRYLFGRMREQGTTSDIVFSPLLYTYLFFGRRLDASNIQIGARYYFGNNFSDGVVTIPISDLINRETIKVTLIKESNTAYVLINDILKNTSSIIGTLNNNFNVMCIGGAGNGDAIDNSCNIDFSVNEVEIRDSTFYNIASNSIGDIINTNIAPNIILKNIPENALNYSRWDTLFNIFIDANSSNEISLVKNSGLINSELVNIGTENVLSRKSGFSTETGGTGLHFSNNSDNLNLDFSSNLWTWKQTIQVNEANYMTAFLCDDSGSTPSQFIARIHVRDTSAFFEVYDDTYSLIHTTAVFSISGRNNYALMRQGTNFYFIINGVIKEILNNSSDTSTPRYIHPIGAVNSYDAFVDNIELVDSNLYDASGLSVNNFLFVPFK